MKPNIENGEPVCSGRQCPDFADCPVVCIPGEPCLPAIKRQLDELIDMITCEVPYRPWHYSNFCRHDIENGKPICRECLVDWLNKEVTNG